MGRVLTNDVALAYALETTESAGSSGIGVLPGSPVWKETEPNEIGAFGATISTIARNPISRQRGRRKGIVSDLDSVVEIDVDLTGDSIRDFLEGFIFAVSTQANLIFNRANAVAGGTPGYTVPAGTAAQAGKLQFTSGGPISLVYASGYLTAGNNGLKPLSADFALTDTTIQVAGVTAETAPAKAVLQIAGIRPEVGDLSITVTSGVATLTSNNNSVTNDIDFTTLGLKVGQFIHIGGLTGANQFSAGAGFGRITSIAAQTLTLDKLSSTLATDTGATETVDLLFGQFISDVATDDTLFLQRSFQFEATFPGLGPSDETEYEYAKGNFCDSISLNAELADKATLSLGFIGTDSETPTTTRKTNADDARAPNGTAAFGTSSDFARLRITEVDETGLTTDFKSMSLVISNNVSAEKTLGTLGARFMNYGNFFVDLEAQILFTSSDVITAIKEYRTVTMDFMLQNDDGLIAVDIPSMSLGGGEREFPLNETVLANLTGQAFQDPILGTSIGVSTFPIVPA